MAHRYFLDSISDNIAYVLGDEAVHLCRVMRIKQGDSIILCDRDGFDYQSSALDINEKQISFEILSKIKNAAEPSKQLTVYMALPKSDKLEFIVQKVCELGATRIVPFVSEFCVAQISKKDGNKKERLQKISNEACKQSGRSVPCRVCDTLTFKEILKDLSYNDLNLFFYENSTEKLRNIDFSQHNNVSIIVGSEGGFSNKEAELFLGNGATSIGLGKRILRCETAAVAAASLVMYSLGEME